MILRKRTVPVDGVNGAAIGGRNRRRLVVVIGLVVATLAVAGLRPASLAEARSGRARSETGAKVGSPRLPKDTSSTSTTSSTTTLAPTTTTVAPTTTTTTTTVAPATTVVPTSSAMWHADADADADGSTRTLFWKKESVNPSGLSIVDDPTGRFGRVYRSHLTPSDITSGNKRAEFSQALLGDGSTKLRLATDVTPAGSTQNMWFGWRSLFGRDVLVNSGHSNDGNYMQLKGDSSCGGPAIGMTIKYGRLTLRSEQYLPEYRNIVWNGPPMTTMFGSWHSFVLHVQFSKDASIGYLEVWLDGARQTMSNGQTRISFPTVCPNDSYIYPKLGVYGMDSAIGGGPEHWFESPRIGASYESVVPR